MALALRVDPWASEYQGAVQFGEDDNDAVPPSGVRLDVELNEAEWQPITPRPTSPPPLVFIDGVRRVEVGVIQEEDARMAFGLFGSYAAGAVLCSPSGAKVEGREVGRRLVLGGGSLHPAVHVGAGSTTLEFQGHSAVENSPRATLQELQNVMRSLEAQISRSYADRQALVFLDGPLTFLLPLEEPILGYVKTLHRMYLPVHLMPILYGLQAGQRTPVFGFGEGSATRYSWFLRLAPPGPIHHRLTGVVRVEVSTSVGERNAVQLADISTARLPRFASHPAWDSRAPQNLFPLSALETDLHHSLGNHLWVRRAIESHLVRKGSGP